MFCVSTFWKALVPFYGTSAGTSAGTSTTDRKFLLDQVKTNLVDMMVKMMAFLAAATTVAGGWIDDPAKRSAAEQRTPHPVPKYVLNLDLPAEERWNHIAKDFVKDVPAMINYLDAYLPVWAQPLVEKLGEHVEPYFKDFGDEIVGLSKALGAPMGDLVALNLVGLIPYLYVFVIGLGVALSWVGLKGREGEGGGGVSEFRLYNVVGHAA
jgi:hypothetical protein